jgi:hypothetical protein
MDPFYTGHPAKFGIDDETRHFARRRDVEECFGQVNASTSNPNADKRVEAARRNSEVVLNDSYVFEADGM